MPEDPANAPDPNATGSQAGIPGAHPGVTGHETEKLEAAAPHGLIRAREHAEGSAPQRDPYSGLGLPGVAQHAFAALAENVRDYAIFLLDPDGLITFWGEGARLIKWWTKDQAEVGEAIGVLGDAVARAERISLECYRSELQV